MGAFKKVSLAVCVALPVNFASFFSGTDVSANIKLPLLNGKAEVVF